MKRQLVALLCLAAASSLYADGEALATSAEFASPLDTLVAMRAVAAVDGLTGLVYRVGETITVTSPGGSETTLVDSAAVNGTYDAWRPSEGGVYTFTNDREGTATFSVRYSIFNAQGAGTVQSPAILMDDDELVDLVDAGTAAAGYVFSLDGTATISGLVPPSGLIVVPQSEGLWRLAESEDGLLTDSPSFASRIDTAAEGPNRKMPAGMRALPIAYSSDNWRGSPSAASTLEFSSEDGTSTFENCLGTGVLDVDMNHGVWTITLTAGERVYTSVITWAKGFVITFR